jgi:hypothetical protein
MRNVRLQMAKPAHFYDIESAEQLFGLLKASARNFSALRGKSTKDLLFLVFGLTHLREWIAPGYDPKDPPSSPEEQFFQDIFRLEEFNILRELCNRSKHMDAKVEATGALYGGTIDDAPDFDAITNFDRGAPLAYFVEGKDVEDLIPVVIRFYEENWFKKPGPGGAAA